MVSLIVLALDGGFYSVRHLELGSSNPGYSFPPPMQRTPEELAEISSYPVLCNACQEHCPSKATGQQSSHAGRDGLLLADAARGDPTGQSENHCNTR